VQEVQFGADVCILALVEADNSAAFCKAVVERSDGRCIPEHFGEGWIRREAE